MYQEKEILSESEKLKKQKNIDIQKKFESIISDYNDKENEDIKQLNNFCLLSRGKKSKIQNQFEKKKIDIGFNDKNKDEIVSVVEEFECINPTRTMDNVNFGITYLNDIQLKKTKGIGKKKTQMVYIVNPSVNMETNILFNVVGKRDESTRSPDFEINFNIPNGDKDGNLLKGNYFGNKLIIKKKYIKNKEGIAEKIEVSLDKLTKDEKWEDIEKMEKFSSKKGKELFENLIK